MHFSSLLIYYPKNFFKHDYFQDTDEKLHTVFKLDITYMLENV